MSSGEFRLAPGDKHDSARKFTTAEMVRAEKEIMQTVLDGRGRAPQLMPVQQAVPLTEARSQLNSSQRNAIEQILTSRDRIQGLQGSAGVGKTSALKTVRERKSRDVILIFHVGVEVGETGDFRFQNQRLDLPVESEVPA